MSKEQGMIEILLNGSQKEVSDVVEKVIKKYNNHNRNDSVADVDIDVIEGHPEDMRRKIQEIFGTKQIKI